MDKTNLILEYKKFYDMVLFVEKGKAFEMEERRKKVCYYCGERLAQIDNKTKKPIEVDHYEDSIGLVCVPCFKLKVEGGKDG
jgi:uncharacterized protein with PIN domain